MRPVLNTYLMHALRAFSTPHYLQLLGDSLKQKRSKRISAVLYTDKHKRLGAANLSHMSFQNKGHGADGWIKHAKITLTGKRKVEGDRERLEIKAWKIIRGCLCLRGFISCVVKGLTLDVAQRKARLRQHTCTETRRPWPTRHDILSPNHSISERSGKKNKTMVKN